MLNKTFTKKLKKWRADGRPWLNDESEFMETLAYSKTTNMTDHTMQTLIDWLETLPENQEITKEMLEQEFNGEV